MTTYAINSFTSLSKEEIIQECIKDIDECRDSQGEPSNYSITHDYAGGHEIVLADDIPTLNEAADLLISTLNKNEWGDDDLYVSIEGIYKDDKSIKSLYVELLNDDPDFDF